MYGKDGEENETIGGRRSCEDIRHWRRVSRCRYRVLTTDDGRVQRVRIIGRPPLLPHLMSAGADVVIGGSDLERLH